MVYSIWISAPGNHKKEISSLLSSLNDAYSGKDIQFEISVRGNSPLPIDSVNTDDEVAGAIQKSRYFFMVINNNNVINDSLIQEFNIAFNQFRRTGKPLIYTYFLRTHHNEAGEEPNNDNLTKEAIDFARTLRYSGSFSGTYDHFESIKLNILTNILRNYECPTFSYPSDIPDETSSKNVENARKTIRNYMSQIKQLEEAGTSENAPLVGLLYNEAAKIIREYCVELHTMYDYVAFLYHQRDSDTAIELGRWLDRCYDYNTNNEKNHSEIKTLLGQIYAQQGRRDEAEILFRDAISLSPENKSAQSELMRLLSNATVEHILWKSSDKPEANQLSTKSERGTSALAQPLKPYSGTDPYIFVSYSHNDNERVLPILNALHHRGYRVWYDDDAQSGSDWKNNIAYYVSRCQTFLCFHSSSSIESSDCRNELLYAMRQKKPVVSAYLDNVHWNRAVDMMLSIRQSISLDKSTTIDGMLERFDYDPILCSCRISIARKIDERTYRNALALNPADKSSRAKLGVLLMPEPGREREAEQLLREVILLDAGNTSVRMQLAQIYKQTGRVQEAKELYREISELKDTESPFAKIGKLCMKFIKHLLD